MILSVLYTPEIINNTEDNCWEYFKSLLYQDQSEVSVIMQFTKVMAVLVKKFGKANYSLLNFAKVAYLLLKQLPCENRKIKIILDIFSQ